MKNSVKIIFIILMGGIIFCLGSSPCPAKEPLELEPLIEEALSSNPQIIVFEKRKDALWEKPPQAKAWDDPMLTLGVTNLPTDDFDFNKQDMTQKTVSLRQNIPFPGIKSLKEKAAVETAKTAEQDLNNMQLTIVRNVKQAYYDYCLNRETHGIIQANLKLLNQFVELTQARYEVGSGLQADVLKAQVSLAKMQEQLITLEQERQTITARLYNLLNRSPSEPIVGEPAMELIELKHTAEELEVMALAANPRLRALEHAVAKSKAEHKLSKKMYFPQFSVTASYGQRDDRVRAKPYPTRVTAPDGSFNDVTTLPLNYDKDRPDFFSFLVGINIPIWFRSKQSRGVSEAFHRVAQVQSEYNSAKNDICFRIRDLHAKADKGRELTTLYKNSIIPSARQTLDADMAAYQVGKTDFLNVLNSQITLFNYEIQYHKAKTSYQKDLAELETIAGARLF